MISSKTWKIFFRTAHPDHSLQFSIVKDLFPLEFLVRKLLLAHGQHPRGADPSKLKDGAEDWASHFHLDLGMYYAWTQDETSVCIAVRLPAADTTQKVAPWVPVTPVSRRLPCAQQPTSTSSVGSLKILIFFLQ